MGYQLVSKKVINYTIVKIKELVKYYMNKKPELLLPAGDINTLKIAFDYGADACYVGGELYSLRAKAINFNDNDLKQAVELAHKQNKKIYITANIYAHNSDIEGVREYFHFLNIIKPDAVLISDMGVFSIAKELLDGIDIHISTQANTTNYESINFYEKLGAKRVVVARELSLNEIREIKNHISENMEIEAFIHGSMCISYSGRCLLSSFFTGKSANLGECTHPCRWKYDIKDKEFDLIENERPDEKFSIMENDRGTYIFNSKDLCMIEHIDDLIDAGIDSFKIEGRMKSELYIATVARVYRKAIDDYINDKNLYKNNISKYKEEIKKCTYREYTTGFFYGYPNETAQIYDNNTYVSGAKLLAIVDKVDNEYFYFEQKNKFNVGDTIEIMSKNFDNIKTKVLEMIDIETGKNVDSCPHSKQKIKIKTDIMPKIGDIIRSI